MSDFIFYTFFRAYLYSLKVNMLFITIYYNKFSIKIKIRVIVHKYSTTFTYIQVHII